MKIYTADFYAALGVAADATSDEIRTAYRAAALKYHPDKNNDKSAQARFLLIQQGYEVLKDSATKAEYDRQYKRSIRPQPEQRARPTRPPPRVQERPEPREWPSWPPKEFQYASFDTNSTPSANFHRARAAFSNGPWWEDLLNRNRRCHTNENNVPGQSNPPENNFDSSYLNNLFGQRSQDAPWPSPPTEQYGRRPRSTTQSRFFPR